MEAYCVQLILSSFLAAFYKSSYNLRPNAYLSQSNNCFFVLAVKYYLELEIDVNKWFYINLIY